MAADLTTVAQLLKNYYGNYIKEQQNLVPYFYDSILGKSDRKPVGNGFIFSTHMGGNMSVGPRNPDEALPRAQNERTRQATITTRHYYSSIEVQNAARDATQNDAGAFTEVLDYEMTEATKTFRKLLNQDAYGTGTSIRTSITAVATSTTHTVAEPWRIRQYQEVDVYDSTLATLKASSRQVTAVNLNASTITVDGAAFTSAVGDVIVIAGTQLNAPTGGKSLTGLAAIIDTTTVSATFENINRSTYPQWQANVITLSPSVGISNDLLQRALDRMLFATGDASMTDCLLSNPLQRRNYLAITVPMKRFMDDNVDSGYKNMTWNGMPWLVDTDCQRDVIYYLHKAGIKRYVLRELGLDDTGGSVMKWLQGYDSTFAFMVCRENMGCERPNAQGKITGLTVPTY